MSFQPQAIPPIPEETVRVARAVLPKGNTFIHMRDEFGTFFRDEDFLDLFSEKGQPAESAWRLALVMIMQYAEGLTDRQAADAVKTRIDWKYALSLEITDPGFDFSVLSEFRGRLLANQAERRLFDIMLSQCRERGWVKERGKQRTDSTHVLAAIRTTNRLECVGEAMRHALNILAEVAPDWLIEHMKPEWSKRYWSRFSDFRLPKDEKPRQDLAEEIGNDGRYLLEKVYESTSPAWLRDVPAVEMARCIWIQQYHANEKGTTWRKDQELPPSALLLQSPYDIEARYSKKKKTGWVGYKVHFTETCDSDQPNLLLEITTTSATLPDGEILEDLHTRLAEKKVLPKQHLVDKGYVHAEIIAKSQEIHQIEIVGPALPDTSWASKEPGRFGHNDFSIDWESKSALCPAGQKSRDWGNIPDRHGKPSLRIRFPLPVCRPCPLHSQCTSVAAKVLILRPEKQSFLALQEARKRQETPEFRTLYAKRAGIEGTVAQAVRTCEIRRARYIGQEKLNLQAFLTATSMNVLRACHWIAEEKGYSEFRVDSCENFTRLLCSHPSWQAERWAFTPVKILSAFHAKIRIADYSIEALSIPCGVAVSEVVKNSISIVLDGQRERQEGINYVRCNLCKPCEVPLQSFFFCRRFINAIKGFFEVVSDFQTWKVPQPRFKDQGFMFVQIIGASEQQKSIVHQGFALLVCQTFSYLLANSFQASRKQFKDVELVYHQFAMRQNLMNSIMVAGPHIRANNGDMLFRCVWQVLQVGNNSWLMSISKQVNDLMVFYVGDDASVLVKQIQFVNSDTGTFEGCYCVQTLYGLSKDEPDKLFVNPHIIGDAGKCSPQGLLSDVKHQALCHEVVLIHIIQWFKEGPVAISTSITLSYNLDTCSPPSDRDVHEKLMLNLMAVESRAGAMWATQNSRFLFGNDLVVMFMLDNRQNAPMGPAKNIQGQFSQFRLLPKEFYTRRVKAVASEGRVSQVHSTHFSDFSMVFTVACFHVVFRIAKQTQSQWTRRKYFARMRRVLQEAKSEWAR